MGELDVWRYLICGIIVTILAFAAVYYIKKNKANTRKLTQGRRTAAGGRESKLDKLIDAIQNFTARWELPKFPYSSYLRQIELEA